MMQDLNKRITADYTVTQRNDYYAWGLPTSTSVNPEAQPYKREGKELDEMHGLNTYDQGARQFGTHLPVTMVPDPMAEKYYSISPYAQWGNNPVRYVDYRGDSLTYIGNTQEVIDMHNVHLSGYYTVSANSEGLVSMAAVEGMDMSTMTPEQKAYADALGVVVNGTDGMTTINVVSDDTNVLFGEINSATIDVGDMAKLPTAQLIPITSGSALIHEVTEQYLLQVQYATLDTRHPQLDAHIRATIVEGRALDQTVGINPDRQMEPPGAKTGYFDVRSSKGNARVHVKDNNVTGVSYYKYYR